ncbi:MAG TPA: hypothetical protein VM491_08205 [Burkholderiaceae bacterium]|jgi:hypothetical protein|nr:hypothetical protein [Burkholderiaceae bacterium]
MELSPAPVRTAVSRPITAEEFRLAIQTLPQPDETTCGPTCLHALYRYWGDDEPLDQVIARNYRMAAGGGTFAVYLACDALRKGYAATIYTFNLTVFDPTWFGRPGVSLADRLQRQRELKDDFRLQQVTPGYLEFLRLGGRLKFVDLSPTLLQKVLRRRFPILTGLSSTYLYHAAREYGPDDVKDDLRGTPSGHFVIIAGYNAARRCVLVVDPYQPHPYGPVHEYWISIDRAVGAIFLGIVTHDANLLIVHPRPKRRP